MNKEFGTNKKKKDILLVTEGVLVGVLAGLTAVFYRYCIVWAEKGLHFIRELVRGNEPALVLWFAALFVMGCLVARMIRLEAMAAGSGIPQVFAEVNGELDSCWWRVILVKFIGGAVSILGGLSLGRAGPSIQLGAMAAKGYTRARKYDKSREILLLSCGAGAGLAATFNAPLAGVMFVLEGIRHTFEKTLLLAGLAAAVSADFISKLFFGTSSIFSFSARALPFRYFWLLILLGILLGLAGAGYNFVMLKTQALFRYMKRVPGEIRLAAVFLTAGILGLFLPQVLAGGQRMIALLAGGQPALKLILLLLVVKFLFSALSFGSGAPGGIFFPLLVLGAYAGAFFGGAVIQIFPLPSELFSQFVILGIAGLFVGIMRTPIAGILLIAELTGSLDSLPDAAIVCIFACATANLLGSKPICESLHENFLINRLR